MKVSLGLARSLGEALVDAVTDEENVVFWPLALSLGKRFVRSRKEDPSDVPIDQEDGTNVAHIQSSQTRSAATQARDQAKAMTVFEQGSDSD